MSKALSRRPQFNLSFRQIWSFPDAVSPIAGVGIDSNVHKSDNYRLGPVSGRLLCGVDYLVSNVFVGFRPNQISLHSR